MNGAKSQLAQALGDHRAGRLEDAARGYAVILEREPAHFDALHMLGAVRAQQADYAGAVRSIEQAIAIRGDFALAHYNLGHARAQLRELEAAVKSYRQAVALDPGHFESWNSLARIYIETGRPFEARACAERAIALRPASLVAQQTHAMTLTMIGEPEAARAALEAVAAGGLDDVITWNFRGMTALRQSNYDAAVAHFDAALAIDPGYYPAMSNRARALAAAPSNRFVEAGDAYRALLERYPEDASAAGGLAHASQLRCDWAELARCWPRAQRALDANRPTLQPIAAAALLDDPALLQAQNRLFAASRAVAVPLEMPLQPPTPRDRLRIGYVSANFNAHPVGFSLRELLARHDRRRVEVIGIACGRDDNSAVRADLIAACDEFYDVAALSPEAACRLLRALDLQVAIDLAGHTGESRPEFFMTRIAPVQVNYFGFPGTWAHPCMDYLIADATVIPAELASYYDERIIRLPDTFFLIDSAVRPAAEAGARAAHGLPDAGFVFACFNTAHKILPEVFAVWMRLLAAVPGSVLWLTPGPQLRADNLRAEAERQGIDARRLVYAGRLERREDYLARQGLADLFLDTLPYNAHSTARDALWAGLPVLTCTGRSFAARVAAALVKAAGLPELVTSSLAEYEALALRLARDPEALGELRRRLAAGRDSAAVFDMRRRARELEWAYRRMHELAVAGEPPCSFDVPRLDAG